MTIIIIIRRAKTRQTTVRVKCLSLKTKQKQQAGKKYTKVQNKKNGMYWRKKIMNILEGW